MTNQIQNQNDKISALDFGLGLTFGFCNLDF